MKTRRGFRALALALSLAALAAGEARAAVLVGWDYANITTNSGTVPPSETLAAGVEATELAATAGGKRIYQGYSGTGWGSGATLSTTGSNDASFTLSADPGEQLTLTSLDYVQPSAMSGTTGKIGVWGYRIDGGSWTIGPSFALNDGTTLVFPTGLSEWDFAAPIVTTGTVEFAFWSYGTTSFANKATKSDASSQIDVVTNVAGNDLSVNGSVSPLAVPEPSAWVLTALGAGLFAWRVRRTGRATE